MTQASAATAPELIELASGLRFPEGPVAMPDGSVVLVEMERQTLTRISADGTSEVVAHLGGGPNGAAIGPDGAMYVCNNGGVAWLERRGLLFPTVGAADYEGGSIQRVDMRSGAVETLYTHCGDRRLKAPNDLVFDSAGGFWFTDHGKLWSEYQDLGAIYYAAADGSEIRLAVFPMTQPNGVGLSPDEAVLYVAETHAGRLWAFDVAAPGTIDPERVVRMEAGRCLLGLGGYQFFDSLAVESGGNICVATLISGGVTVVSEAGAVVDWLPLPDRFPTNICFGGEDLSTAFMTLSGTGKLVSAKWPRPGLGLNFPKLH